MQAITVTAQYTKWVHDTTLPVGLSLWHFNIFAHLPLPRTRPMTPLLTYRPTYEEGRAVPAPTLIRPLWDAFCNHLRDPTLPEIREPCSQTFLSQLLKGLCLTWIVSQGRSSAQKANCMTANMKISTSNKNWSDLLSLINNNNKSGYQLMYIAHYHITVTSPT